MNQVELIGLLSGLVSLLRHADKVGIDVADQVKDLIHHKLPAPVIPGHYVMFSGLRVEAPTSNEVNIGQNKGKLDMVKEYKSRTGRSLMEAKKLCEEYFESRGLEFYRQRY